MAKDITPTTISQQASLLKEQGLICNDTEDEDLTEYLRNNNYYRVKSYFIRLKESGQPEKEHVKFSELRELYNLDEALRILLIKYLLRIEITFRQTLAYRLSHYYTDGDLLSKAYDSRVFFDKDRYDEMVEKVRSTIQETRKRKYTHYDEEDLQNPVPLWVFVEYMSFTDLSKMVKNLHLQFVGKHILQDFDSGLLTVKMFNNLHSLVELRNACAHSNPLYRTRFKIRPKLERGWKMLVPTDSEGNTVNCVFTLIIACVSFLDKRSRGELLDDLQDLFTYTSVICEEDYGFCKGWYERIQLFLEDESWIEETSM